MEKNAAPRTGRAGGHGPAGKEKVEREFDQALVVNAYLQALQ